MPRRERNRQVVVTILDTGLVANTRTAMAPSTMTSNRLTMAGVGDDGVNPITVVRLWMLMDSSICRRGRMATASADGIRDHGLLEQGQPKHLVVGVARLAFHTSPVVLHLAKQRSTELHTWPVLTHISTRRRACACRPMGSAPSPLKDEDSLSDVPLPKMEGMVITPSTCASAQ